MRIRAFNKLIDENLAQLTLNDSSVVIDGQNFFYKFYQESGLQYMFGCESNNFADYLRKYLARFINCNIKCYFIFKGGHKDLDKKLKSSNDHMEGENYNIDNVNHDNDIVPPVFMKDVYKQVLGEMGFSYSICECEAKTEVIAFAQKYDCPIISYDIEFCFSGVPYIPSTSLTYNETRNQFKCGVFTLANFQKKYNLTQEKLAIFITLTDEKLFPEDHFSNFLNSLNCPLGNFRRNLHILKWLSRSYSMDRALQQIIRYTGEEHRNRIIEVVSQMRDFILRKETPGLPTEYLMNNNKIDFFDNDPLWFEKGIVSKHIAIPLVNIVRTGIIVGSWAIEDNKADDGMLLSLDIIKYIYNLLTNFEKDNIVFLDYNYDTNIETRLSFTLTDSVSKPSYGALPGAFVNGWDRLDTGLFEHFLSETFEHFDFDLFNELPEDSKLLVIALVYFSHKKTENTVCEVYGVLLSYIALNMDVNGEINNNERNGGKEKWLRNSITHKEMLKEDKLLASQILATYFKRVGREQAIEIFDRKIVHPLVEFQYCLMYLNYLNQLCGCPYMPVNYSKTFNGTFVYVVVYAMKMDCGGDGFKFINETLNQVPSVLSFINHLFEVYQNFLGK